MLIDVEDTRQRASESQEGKFFSVSPKILFLFRASHAMVDRFLVLKGSM